MLQKLLVVMAVTSLQRENTTFYPEPSESKMKAWGEGMLNLTRDVQNALGKDKLKEADQPYVKAVQIEYFYAKNVSINRLMLGLKRVK